MKRSYNFGYFIAEGFRSIFTHGLMSFAAVFMILACLIIMGSFSLVAVNFERELGQLEADNQFLAFVDETYTREQAQAIQAKLEALEMSPMWSLPPKNRPRRIMRPNTRETRIRSFTRSFPPRYSGIGMPST